MSKSYDKNLFRIANVGYLNSTPFRAAAQLEWVDYFESSPAECARKLREDECDLACIPLADFYSHGGYEALSYGIVSRGPVESVFLFSDRPVDQIKRVFIDSSSHTSAVSLRLILQRLIPDSADQIQLFRVPPEEVLARIGSDSAGLLIGDIALKHSSRFEYKIDFGAFWEKETQLPFVFAVWAGKPERLSQRIVSLLENTFEVGTVHREVYARDWADEHQFDREKAVDYLKNRILYRLDDLAIKGAEQFHKRGYEAGIFPESSTLRLNKSVLTNGAGTTNAVPAAGPNSTRTRLDSVLIAASHGERISIDDGLFLAKHASLHDLALASTVRRKALHPEKSVSYIVDRNINYTNVCNIYCRFCAFYRAPGKSDGYVLTKEEIGKKIEETIEAGGVQILLQGGLNPELGIEYYEDLFAWIVEHYPINLHALSADEIQHISRVSNISIEEVLKRLIAAGMGSLPGGGGEILVDRVRYRIARLKTTADEWLEVHRRAHLLGITSTCTMMFGVQESWEDRLLHMQKLRLLQDETGGFTAFIAWPFQEENTKLKKGDTSAPEYLRVQALSRIFIDNIDNIQSSWVTQGPSIGQIALFYGANDFGSVMFEENVVSAAGTTFYMNGEFIERHITEAGFAPWRRDVHYNQLSHP